MSRDHFYKEQRITELESIFRDEFNLRDLNL